MPIPSPDLRPFVSVPAWVARLAAELLREYKDRLSNDGCNDYDVPDWVPMDELLDLAALWNRGPVEPDIVNYNWAVVGTVAEVLSPEPRP